MSSSEPISVLFVCLGNICRSPMAEAIFAHEASKRGLSQRISVDSAGTGAYHVGDDPDPRTVSTLAKHSIPIFSHARQVDPSDYVKFHTIFAMDEQNLKNLERGKPKGGGTAKVILFSAYGDKKSISDPYYGGPSGFERAYQQCVRYSREFLDVLEKEGIVSSS